MFVYQAYDGIYTALNAYLWFDCSNGRWTRSLVGAGDLLVGQSVGESACPFQWACTGSYPTGITIEPFSWRSCPTTGAQTCLSPPPPPPPPPRLSPPPPPPPPPPSHSHSPANLLDEFTVTSGACTVDPSSPNCIRSPNFPSNYGNNETCVITPTALAIGIPLTATSFDVIFFFDDDELRIPSHPDGTLEAFSLFGPLNFISGPWTIQWSSDISVNDTGWRRVCSETSNDLNDLTGVIVGVIVGVLVGLGVCLGLGLGLCLYCCLSRRRKEARGPPPLQRPTTEAHQPQPAVATKTNLTTQANLNLMSA